MSSFETYIHFEQRYTGIHKIHLALSQYEPPVKKELIDAGGHTKVSRKTPKEHLSTLFSEGRLKECNRPFILISARNVLANLRCIAYLKGYTKRPVAVAEEDNNVFKSRPYHVLGEKNGKFTIEIWDPKTWDSDTDFPFSWFISGVPVLWDDADEDALFKMIVTEAADHSHVWYLPRGSHPDATDATRNHWKNLQKIFMDTLTSSKEAVYDELNLYSKDNCLKREDNYLHNILGIDSEGNLCQLISSGKLEELGQQIKKQGVRRALCVDNSGSITVQFFYKGIAGALTDEYRQLVSAPNHRPPGTAYLVIELKDATFGSLKEV